MSKHGTGYPKIQVTLRPNEITEIDNFFGWGVHFGLRAATLRAFVRYCIIHKEQVLEYLKQHEELTKL